MRVRASHSPTASLFMVHFLCMVKGFAVKATADDLAYDRNGNIHLVWHNLPCS